MARRAICREKENEDEEEKEKEEELKDQKTPMQSNLCLLMKFTTRTVKYNT